MRPLTLALITSVTVFQTARLSVGAFTVVAVNLPSASDYLAGESARLSDNGEIVGNVGNFDWQFDRAFCWNNGQSSYIATPAGFSTTTVSGISNDGTAVGWASSAAGVSAAHTVGAAGMSLVPGPGGSSFIATGVNDGGQIVGATLHDDPATKLTLSRAVTVEGGRFTPLDVPGGSGLDFGATPRDVNDAGVIVGDHYYEPTTSTARTDAFVWKNGRATILPGLGGGDDTAYAVNGLGQVVGRTTATTNVSGYAATWSAGGKLTVIGKMSGDQYASAVGIDDAGEIVGVSVAASGTSRAFLYADGVMTPLDALVPASAGLHLTEADDINNLGQVLAEGTMNGSHGLFLLTPTLSSMSAEPINEVAATGAAVPEPAAVAVVGLAVRLLGRRRRAA